MTKKHLLQIEKRIAAIKVKLAAIDQMRPGSLTRQFKDPVNQTGAYYQLSYTRAMRSRTEYIASGAVPDIRRQVANYQRFKELSGEWVDLGIEHSRLKIKAARQT